MKLAAVIGHPISHSLSPAIFTFVSKQEALPVDYKAIDIPPENLADFVKLVKKNPDWAGFNVTIPHKETIYSHLDEVAPEAQAIGAVNVVKLENGRATGINTDVRGILSTWSEHKVNLLGATVLVLGAGGAARAAAFAAAQAGAEQVWVLARNVVQAHKITNALGGVFLATTFHILGKIEQWQKSNFEKLRLVVNTTPVGMQGYHAPGGEKWFADIFDRISKEKPDLKAHKPAAFDLVYRPRQTFFLNAASQNGFRTIGGVDMLIYQALATWEIWFKPLRSVAKVKADLAVHLSAFL